jgi:hypothetical protein
MRLLPALRLAALTTPLFSACAMPPPPVQWSAQASGVTATLRGVGGTIDGLVAVGDGGTIVRSTDAGAHWKTVASGTTADLVAVGSNDGCESPFLFAVGDHGTILASHDQGLTWKAQASPVAAMLTSVRLEADWGLEPPAAQLVTSADGNVLVSFDYGMSWQRTLLDGAPALRTAAIGCDRFMVGGDGGALFISADGYKWRPVTSGTAAAIRSINCSLSDILLAADGGVLVDLSSRPLRLIDSGTTANLRAIHWGFTRPIIVGDVGTILDDWLGSGGIQPPVHDPSPVAADLFDVWGEGCYRPPDRQLFAVGAGGTVLHAVHVDGVDNK